MTYTEFSNKLSNIKKISSSLHAFNYYVAKQFSNIIANKAPTVKFKNEQLNSFWENDKVLNKFTKLNREVVRKCSLYGTLYVGIVPIKSLTTNNYLPSITVGIPIDVLYIGQNLVRLVILIDIVKRNSSSYFVIEEWDVEKNFFHRDLVDEMANLVLSDDLMRVTLNNKNGWSPFLQKIPYVPFFANSEQQPDLNDVPKEWFEQFDINLQVLKSDTIVNKGLIVGNVTNAAKNASFIALKRALQNPNEVIVDYQGFGGILGDQVFNFIQGNSYAQNIIAKLTYLERLIKKFGFIRTDTSNLGVKNTVNAEIENINADADDYIEFKANLLEESWTLFFKTVYVRYYLEMNLISENGDFDVDVEVPGSTKYLQNPVNKYIQNQVGVLTNPNDLKTSKENENDDKKVQQD